MVGSAACTSWGCRAIQSPPMSARCCSCFRSFGGSQGAATAFRSRRRHRSRIAPCSCRLRAPTVFSYARRLPRPPRRARAAPSSAWRRSATAAGRRSRPMIEDEGAQQVVAFYDAILESRGIRLAPDSMILDYGCGSGRHTYEYLDAGYCNAFGYDLQNYVALRAPKDRERFRFDPIPGNAGGYPRMSEVPWPADTFHFIFATSVF